MTKKSSEMYKRVADVMVCTRNTKPLVECITNYVTVNDCANAILAVGGSPVMGEEEIEIEDFVAMSKCLLINLGVITPRTFSSMLVAGIKANEVGVPVVFDPVGVGATRYRDRACKQFLNEVKVDVIRGNMSEIRSLGGLSSNTKGVDASESDAVTKDNIEKAGAEIQEIAKKYNCVVAATGKIDIIASPDNVYYVENGCDMLSEVTGTGCMTSAITAAFCGGKNDFEAATIAGILFMCIAGEKGFEYVQNDGSGSGTFRTKLIDYINTMTSSDIEERGNVYEA